MDLDYIRKLSPAERKELLSANAMGIEETTYTRPLSEEEIVYWKDQLTENSIRQSELLEERKNEAKAFSDKLKPIQTNISKALKATKYKAIDCKGILYHLDDQDEQMITTLDADGNVINKRRMLPNERQTRLKTLKQESA
jgi:hypothetical protein